MKQEEFDRQLKTLLRNYGHKYYKQANQRQEYDRCDRKIIPLIKELFSKHLPQSPRTVTVEEGINITEEEICDAFYDWESRQSYHDDQFFAALKGWNAACDWILSQSPRTVTVEEITDVLKGKDWGFGFVPSGAVRIEYIKAVAQAIHDLIN